MTFKPLCSLCLLYEYASSYFLIMLNQKLFRGISHDRTAH
jgi:hypothetical protein